MQKKCEMIPKLTSTQNMVNLVGKGKLSRVLQVCLMKLTEANDIYQYLYFVHRSNNKSNIKVIIPTGFRT